MRNRGIGRGRLFMGSLLLLAAVLTWSIGLMMSPHGEAVATGTDYLRTTIVIFKRNSAIGTLVLSALAAWLLFPIRRPKWPARDWALIAIVAFLAGSSLYTLVWLEMTVPQGGNVDQNLASTSFNEDLNASGSNPAPLNVPHAPSAVQNQLEVSAIPSAALVEARKRTIEPPAPDEVSASKEPPETVTSPISPSGDERANNEVNEE